MAENIRARQDHISFLEGYIEKLNEKIEEITGGRDMEKEIASLKYRVEVLQKSNGRFPSRIKELEQELKTLEEEYDEIKPTLDELIEERAYYREVQGEI